MGKTSSIESSMPEPYPRHAIRGRCAFNYQDIEIGARKWQCVLSGTWVTEYSEHIGNTFRYLRGCANAVAGVFQDGRTAAVRGSVAWRGEDGGGVARGRYLSQ